MLEPEATAREQIVTLLGKELGREISHNDFRIAFEELFNLKLDRSEASPTEFAALQALFDTIVWYSPFPDDRGRYPHYKSEREVEEAVEKARCDLGLVGGATVPDSS